LLGDAAIPSRWTYAGIFFVALSTLMFEILLTRIFSVTMWYHFAFVAVSVAMFGLTFGAMLVYRFPAFFRTEFTKQHLAFFGVAFSVTVVLGFLTQQSVPFVTDPSASVISYYAIGLNYLAISIPFIASGICICLVLTRFPLNVGSLYAADLVGAAGGCIAILLVLSVADATTAVFVVATLAGLGAVCFARDQSNATVRRWATRATLALGVIALAQGASYHLGSPMIRLLWVMGAIDTPSLYERWNVHSRVIARGTPEEYSRPVNMGLSNVYPGTPRVRQLMLCIDVIGATMVTWNDPARSEELDFLKWVIPNITHHIRPDADVLVVGVGGGVDILSALVLDQKSVKGVEINSSILDAITNRFSEMSPHLKDPRVTLVNDEGRSAIARDPNSYDMIQFTYVDTFAASAAGAFVLTENGLYTIEAWTSYLDHLKPNGILTVSHFYLRELPVQVYRMLALAVASLQEIGVENPERHIVLVRKEEGHQSGIGKGHDDIATILVSRDPFSEEDLDALDSLCTKMSFQVLQSPRTSADSNFADIASGREPAELLSKYAVNVSAPTDDSPFFFHTLRLTGIFDPALNEQGVLSVNYRAIRILAFLLFGVTLLTAICILGPLLLKKELPAPGRPLPFLGFFTAIGLGFMLIEIAQMQRFSIFLGHPVYGLAVVLFSLLISSGIGSMMTSGISPESGSRSAQIRLAMLVVLLIVFGFITTPLTEMFRSESNPVRIGVAVLVLIPMGLVMGMAFPIGMRFASLAYPTMTAWFWGINGAASVCGSVLAIAVAIAYGISDTYIIGILCYVAAAIMFAWASRRARTVKL